jgi:hypothetical protein
MMGRLVPKSMTRVGRIPFGLGHLSCVSWQFVSHRKANIKPGPGSVASESDRIGISGMIGLAYERSVSMARATMVKLRPPQKSSTVEERDIWGPY